MVEGSITAAFIAAVLCYNIPVLSGRRKPIPIDKTKRCKAIALQNVRSFHSDVLIPEGVTYLNGSAFSYDSVMKSIAVPKTVTSVDTYWNWGCYPSIVYFEPGDGLRMRSLFDRAGFSEVGIQFKQRKEVAANYKELYEISGDGKHEWIIDDTVSAAGGVSLRSGKIGDYKVVF